MRLLKTDTLEIQEFGFGEIPNYAILSHRWYKYELNLRDVEARIWESPGFDNLNNEIKINAFEKINQCCIRAKSDSFEYVWIDSCCIDKTSSAELSEAINSMYLWYYKASRCYAYLSDVISKSAFQESEWFTRGWTLQELLAPAEVYFLNKDWKDLGTKTSLQQEISDRTRIPVNILSGGDLETATVAQRMSWASQRKTSRIEDRAYSLMGIFGINMPLLYGEGERAFIRLQEEIMRVSNDHSLFAWKSPDIRCGLLATSPDAFVDSSNIVQYSPFGDHNGAVTVDSRGIHLELRIIGRGPGGLGMAILHCAERDKEDKLLAIYVKDIALTMEQFERVRSERLEWVNMRRFRRWQYPMRKIWIRMGRIGTMGRVKASDNQDGAMKEVHDDIPLSSAVSFPDATELFRAAQAGDHHAVWVFLTRTEDAARLKDNEGRTVLWHAVMGRCEVLVKILLARSDVDPDVKDIYGRTPLSWAAEEGHDAIVKLLLEKSVDIEAAYNQSTPLYLAVRGGHDAVIEQLLEKGADNKLLNALYGTIGLVSWATMNGYEAVAKLLLEKGADIEQPDGDGKTPLLWAADLGRESIVKMLLEEGADMKKTDTVFGLTALLRAALSGHEAVAKLLLEKGADIEETDPNGKTSLLWAADLGRESIVKMLLEEGADMKKTDTVLGQTALLRAAQNGHEAVVKLLLEKGADIEGKDFKRQTALSWASQNGHEAIVKLLIEGGADIEAKDYVGGMPLSTSAD